MYRTKDWGGIALAHLVSLVCSLITSQTLLLIMYGMFCANRFTIFYWYYRPSLADQFIQGIPLSGWGLYYCVTFNGLCFLAIVAHLRAACTDPGRIPEGLKAPFQSEHMEIKFCEKCIGKETWKPARAHHCQACGFCVFKVRSAVC